MPFDPATFEPDLTAALDRFDKETAVALCDELMQALGNPGAPITSGTLEYALQSLRNKRLFTLIQKMADLAIQLGIRTYKIRRQYAQALIDQGMYAAALCILHQLETETRQATGPAAANENTEALGLIGRVYKQQYVNAGRPADPRIANLMKLAIDHYRRAYDHDADNNLWHGINL